MPSTNRRMLIYNKMKPWSFNISFIFLTLVFISEIEQFNEGMKRGTPSLWIFKKWSRTQQQFAELILLLLGD